MGRRFGFRQLREGGTTALPRPGLMPQWGPRLDRRDDPVADLAIGIELRLRRHVWPSVCLVERPRISPSVRRLAKPPGLTSGNAQCISRRAERGGRIPHGVAGGTVDGAEPTLPSPAGEDEDTGGRGADRRARAGARPLTSPAGTAGGPLTRGTIRTLPASRLKPRITRGSRCASAAQSVLARERTRFRDVDNKKGFRRATKEKHCPMLIIMTTMLMSQERRHTAIQRLEDCGPPRGPESSMDDARREATARSVAARIGTNAARLSSALESHMKDSFRPESRKSLRKFTPAELAELTGASPSNIRRLHQEGKFPEVEADARGRRLYSAEEIDLIRTILAENVRGGESYRTGRRAGEKLAVLAVANFKGGSGKSTTAGILAQRYALRGYRVLALDMDPQASLTTLFGYRPELEFSEGGTVYEALRYDDERVPLSKVIRETYFHNLDVAPAGLMLSEYETETAHALSRSIHPPFYSRLSNALREVEADYDIVIIDCPPQLGFITLTALVAATGILITVIPSMLDIASMSQFMALASELVRQIEPVADIDWDFMRFLISRYEPSDVPQTQMAGFLRSILLNQVLHTPLLKSTAISDAGMTQQTIYEVDPRLFVRKTLDRILESANGVADEVEEIIRKETWGRVEAH